MKKKLTTAIVAILVLLLIGSGAWLLWLSNQPVTAPPAPNLPQAIDAPSAAPTGPTGALVKEDTETTEGTIVRDADLLHPLGQGFIVKKNEYTQTYMEPKKMKPNRLFIPCISSYARIESNPLVGTKKPTLKLNPNPAIVSHWDGGSTVTAKDGTLLLAGHVDYMGVIGSLYRLNTIKAGCVAYVTDEKGNLASFKLVKTDEIHKGNGNLKTFPVTVNGVKQTIWQPHGQRRLILVTCGGKLLPTGHYEDNIIATFLPV